LYDTPTQRGFGIALYGIPGTALDYGGFFAGTLSPSRAQFPATQNVITGNHVEDGSYAVSIQYSEHNSVVGNVFRNQKRRSIYLAAAAFANTISGNVCIDYGSSGVVLGYNSYDNVVNGNRFETTDISGEAAVNINTGSSNNLISGNSIVSATNYGVYLGCDVSNNVVSSNNISNYYLAGVCVENDFVTPRPANAIYSRPNYVPPPSPYTEWSQKNSTGNVIQGNTFGAGYSGRGTASIAVAQLDGNNTTETIGTIISDNVVNSGDNITYNMHMYANTSTRLTDTTITGNNFNSANTFLNTDSSGTTSWYPRINYYKNNKELDIILDAEDITFADGDTTPSISINAGPSNNRVYVFVNLASTTVTDFDDGIDGQVITLRLNPFTTIAYTSGLIRPKGLVDVVGGSTNQFIQFRQSLGVWFETWRNF